MGNMNLQISGSNGINIVPLDSRLLSERKIFIEGDIKNETAVEFVKKVMYLNAEDDKEPIHVFINSFGGEINSGLLMYDVIQSSKAPIKLYCIGCAYSMGAILLASGIHGRYIFPNSKVMIHEPLISGGVGGSTSSIKSVADSMLANKKQLVTLLSKHTGKSEKEVAKAISYDNYMTAQEAVKFGICDKVIDFSMIREVM